MATLESYFAKAGEQIQAFLSRQSERMADMANAPIYSKYAVWGAPKIGLNVKALVGFKQFNVIAPTIGNGTNEPTLVNNPAQTFDISVLNHAVSVKMEADTKRSLMEIVQSSAVSEKDKLNRIIKYAFNDAQTAVDAVHGKIDFLFLSALSNEGKATLNATNNGAGRLITEIDYHLPNGNKFTNTTAWTAANKATATPIEDVIQTINNIRALGGGVGKVLISSTAMAYLLSCPSTRNEIWGTQLAKTPTEKDVQDYFASRGLPQFEIVAKQSRVLNEDRSTSIVKPFNDSYLAFVPSGKIATIENAYSDCELQRENGVKYYNSGRIVVSSWTNGVVNGGNIASITKAESLSIPTFNDINEIFSLNVQLS